MCGVYPQQRRRCRLYCILVLRYPGVGHNMARTFASCVRPQNHYPRILLVVSENRRNSAGLAFKPHRRKCRVEARGQVFWRFSLEATRTVRFQRLHQANAMRSRTDDAETIVSMRGRSSVG